MEYPNNPPINKISLPIHPWFKSRMFKGVLIAIGVIAVLSIVLFNQQIGNLLRFFGSKAALDTDTITLDGTSFLNNHTAELWNTTLNDWESNNNAVDVQNNRLIIKP